MTKLRGSSWVGGKWQRGKALQQPHLKASPWSPPAPLCCREFPGALTGPPASLGFHQKLYLPSEVKSRFLDFRAKTVFIHFEENCLHRSYCFWLSADLGFTSGLDYLSATTGNCLVFEQWISGWCSGRNSHQENMLVCQTTKIHPTLTVQRVGVQWSLGLWHCRARCLFGEQITQYNLEQPLVLLPTEAHKSNISILLASELFTN